MRTAKGVALLGFLAMGAALLYAFAAGNLAEEGSILLSMPWGLVSLVDLCVGFVLFSGWIVHREGVRVRAAMWILSVMVLGFFAASLYALIALQTSGGDWQRFWLGHRSVQLHREPST